MDKVFAQALAGIPAPFRERLQTTWESFRAATRSDAVDIPLDREFLQVLLRVWEASEFVASVCVGAPAVLADLLAAGDLHRAYVDDEYRPRLRELAAAANSEDALAAMLRQFRRREMLRIAWRDLAGWARLEEVLQDLSKLADACLATAVERAYAWSCDEFGVPESEAAEPQQLVVLGMGKLGAHELNFSSDIDLIFAFPESGQTARRASVINEDFFSRLCHRVVHLLNTQTEDGFVFRVDTRLRPYGDSGPIVMSFAAMDEYYQSQARDWERYAMIKARPVAGDLVAGEQLMTMLRPFVYRRYLDFGAFESLRAMKAMIEQQERRRGLGDNVKLGAGGIREIEFIAQAFQMIRGGREPALQERRLLLVLSRLAEAGHLPDFVAKTLRRNYCFLRRMENRLQAWRDQQTHVLPTTDEACLRLARAMGFADWAACSDTLERMRTQVHGQFEQVFAAPQAEPVTDAVAAIWADTLDTDLAIDQLGVMGYEQSEEVLAQLGSLRESYACRALSPVGRQRLDVLMPLVIRVVATSPSPDTTLQRILGMVESVAQRTVYLALLAEHPVALSQLVRLASASPRIVHELGQYPILLDGLLDARSLYAPLDHDALAADLEQQFATVAADDLEQQMEILRLFARGHVLRVAAADVIAGLAVNKVSTHLSAIAEVVLQKVLEMSRDHLVQRYGEPQYCLAGEQRTAGFAVIAYGKLGGRELGYGSDLDLVFLHDSEGEDQVTNGAEEIDNHVFFARLGQRMIHILGTSTVTGMLYEVDMRLRPSGASGMLVSAVEAFEDYQRNDAWVWEHQALVRARPVAGSAAIAARFGEIRAAILCQRRPVGPLREAVRDMRERMRTELGSRPGVAAFGLKQDPGGIADIEFMVQFMALRWAHKHPQLVEFTDNAGLLAALTQAGVMPARAAGSLREAYLAYRAAVHACALDERPASAGEDEFADYRVLVTRLWKKLLMPA